MSFQLNINLSLIEAQISFDGINWQRYWSPDVGRIFAFSTLLKPESEDSKVLQNIQIYLCYYEPNHSSDIRIDGTINFMKSDLRFSFGREKHCFWCTKKEQKNTKNWYTIDALGAILPIMTVLILGISQNISKIYQNISKYIKIYQNI